MFFRRLSVLIMQIFHWIFRNFLEEQTCKQFFLQKDILGAKSCYISQSMLWPLEGPNNIFLGCAKLFEKIMNFKVLFYSNSFYPKQKMSRKEINLRFALTNFVLNFPEYLLWLQLGNNSSEIKLQRQKLWAPNQF